MKKNTVMRLLNPFITNVNFNCIIKNISYYFLNAIRNFLISRIENYSIKAVIFFFNTSVLSDEVMAHRIGLIPLINNCVFEKLYNYEEIKEVFFEINYDCCKEKIYLLSSNSITINKEFPLLRPCFYSINNKNNQKKKGFLITKLKKFQKLNIKMYLEKNDGIFHTKWTICSGILFLKLPGLKWNFLIIKAINYLEKNILCKILIRYKKTIQLNFFQILLRKLNSADFDGDIINLVGLLKDLKFLEFNDSKNLLFKFETNGALLTKYMILYSIEKVLKSIDLVSNNFEWKFYKKWDSNP